MAVVIFCMIGVGFGGLYLSGIKVNSLDLAPNNSGVVMGYTNSFGSAAGFIVPNVVGLLTPNVNI